MILRSKRVNEDRPDSHLKALLGEDVERAVSHFDEKAARSDTDRDGYRPAEVLVQLLVRLARYDDAINAFRRYLKRRPSRRAVLPVVAAAVPDGW